jgi:hypothetical protein
VQDLAPIAFVAEPREGAAVEVRVNFGIFAGRDVTRAEIDDLTTLLLEEVREVSIVSEERHEIDRDVEISVHQVRVEIADDAVPEEADVATLATRVATLAERWAESCISERHAEISEA